MKAYRTTREFARAVSRENGKDRPKQTYYIVEDWQHAVSTQPKAPNSYHGLKRVMFFADGRYVTRRFGLWIEQASDWDTDWLMQRQLREAFDRLWDKDLQCPFLTASRNVEPEVEEKLNRYLCDARWNLYEKFNRKVIEEAARLMEKDHCFGTLHYRGDLLEQQPAA
jgi:hypothetical protein